MARSAALVGGDDLIVGHDVALVAPERVDEAAHEVHTARLPAVHARRARDDVPRHPPRGVLHRDLLPSVLVERRHRRVLSVAARAAGEHVLAREDDERGVDRARGLRRRLGGRDT